MPYHDRLFVDRRCGEAHKYSTKNSVLPSTTYFESETDKNAHSSRDTSCATSDNQDSPVSMATITLLPSKRTVQLKSQGSRPESPFPYFLFKLQARPRFSHSHDSSVPPRAAPQRSPTFPFIFFIFFFVLRAYKKSCGTLTVGMLSLFH